MLPSSLTGLASVNGGVGIDVGGHFDNNGRHHPERLRDRALRRRGNQSVNRIVKI
jgi:hypothetical protein